MKNKIILLAVLALLALGIDAQTITHSFRNTSMSDALRYLSTVPSPTRSATLPCPMPCAI